MAGQWRRRLWFLVSPATTRPAIGGVGSFTIFSGGGLRGGTTAASKRHFGRTQNSWITGQLATSTTRNGTLRGPLALPAHCS